LMDGRAFDDLSDRELMELYMERAAIVGLLDD